MGILGDMTSERKDFIIDAIENNMPDKELFEKLGDVEEQKFTEFLKALDDADETAVFNQELSVEDLANVVGGDGKTGDVNCVKAHWRNIYEGGFPNCAATVEEGSWCGDNDACGGYAIRYYYLSCKLFNCTKAWR